MNTERKWADMNIYNSINTYFEKEKSSLDFSLQRIVFYFSMAYIYTYVRGIFDVAEGFVTKENSAVWKPVGIFTPLSHEFITGIFFDGMNELFILSLIFCGFGLGFRFFSWLAFFLGLYIMGLPLNFGKVHHSNHLPVVVMGIMALSNLSGYISVDNILKNKLKFLKPEPKSHTVFNLISIFLLLHFSLVYFASGFQKLRHSGLEWIFSENLQTIILTRPSVTELGLFISNFYWLAVLLAFFTVLFEFFAPLSMLDKRLKFIFMGGCCMMHVGAKMILGAHGDFTPYVFCFSVLVPWFSLWESINLKGKLLKR